MNATLTPRRTRPQIEVLYNPPTSLGLVIGFCLIIIGFFGLVWPNFFSLNLSFMHCFVLLGSGGLSIYGALTRNKKTTFRIYLSLSVFFLLNAVLGWVLARPGVAQFAFYSPEELKRFAPGFLELGTIDHIVHTSLAVLFLSEAMFWKEYLLGRERHLAQKQALFRISKYLLTATIMLMVFVVVHQILKGQVFSR